MEGQADTGSAGGTATEAREGAEDAAGQAQEKVQEVTGQAQEKAQEAAGQARGVLREQIDQRSSEAGQRASSTSGDLRTIGEKLREEGQDTPAQLADKAAEQAERIGNYLADADADSLLSDVEDFGRRQPLAVLGGGLVLGIAAARFLKASSRRRYESSGSSGNGSGGGVPSQGSAPTDRVGTEPRQPLAPPIRTAGDQVPAQPADPSLDPAVR